MSAVEISTVPTLELVIDELIDIIRKHTKSENTDWNAATTMTQAGIDSFDLVELVFQVEDKYGIVVNFNANTTLSETATIADIASMIIDSLDAKGPGL